MLCSANPSTPSSGAWCLVLGHMPNPQRAIRHLVSLVRRRGLVIFQEFDVSIARSHPASPLFERCIQMMVETFRKAGADMTVGVSLYALFLNAGLPPPRLRHDAAIGCGPGHVAYQVVAEVTRSLAPLMEKYGIAGLHQLDLDTLRDRIESEVVASDGIIVSPALIGAWSEVL
jgi:hypothetical protein